MSRTDTLSNVPTPDEFARLAPFSLDELVSAINGVLREHPRLAVSARTVRYYIAQRLLPPPAGNPKFARYGRDHLLLTAAIRALMAGGASLPEAAEEARRTLERPDASERVATLVAGAGDDAILAEESAEAMVESPRPRNRNRRSSTEGELVRRLRLGPKLVLEVSGEAIEPDDLTRAHAALDTMLND